MADRELSIVLGALARSTRQRAKPAPDALASRWRALPLAQPSPDARSDVISIMDGWIRLLERQAAAEERVPTR